MEIYIRAVYTLTFIPIAISYKVCHAIRTVLKLQYARCDSGIMTLDISTLFKIDLGTLFIYLFIFRYERCYRFLFDDFDAIDSVRKHSRFPNVGFSAQNGMFVFQ